MSTMIDDLIRRPSSHALFVRHAFGALLLLALVTLAGCNLDGSSGSTGVTPAAVSSIEITPTNPSVAKGTSTQLTATAIYSDNSHAALTADLTWSSSNPSVATVSNSGSVSAVGVGSATISSTCNLASVCGSVSGSATLTVTPATLVSIAVTPVIPSIALGTSQLFTATGTFSDNTTQNLSADLTWTSSNTSVATVSGSGLVSTVGAGNATISATCKLATVCGSLSGSATLTVTPATLVSIAITPSAPSIALGSSETFTATGTYSDNTTHDLSSQVTWTSATPAVATISNAAGSAGVASSVAAGTTEITAMLGSVTSPAITMTVTPATLVSLAITPSAPSIALGGSETFTATGTYSDNSTQNLTGGVTWVSATLAVATISNAAGFAGIASSVAVGTTQITAVLGSVTSPATTLTVTPATLVSIAITSASPSIPVAGTEQFVATGTYSDNSTQTLTNTVTWTSSDTSAASISNANGSRGLATGLLAGSSSISATLGGITASPAVTLTITARVESVLRYFAGSDGRNAYGGLVQGTDGNFYGTPQSGGEYNRGTVLSITPAGVETVLWSFGNGSDGQYPCAALIQGTDGNFYGTTPNGGANGFGTVFNITPAGVETVLWSFGSGNDGRGPCAALIQGTDGNFYGTTQSGGAQGHGTVFAITPTGVETVLWSFGNGSDGKNPVAALIQGTDGNFYGTTTSGGIYNGHGTVFKVTPAGVETVLWSFGNGSDGQNPRAALIQGTDGNLYGTTTNGGTQTAGTIFSITPAGIETVLWSFGNGSDGQNPFAGLIQGQDGNFYGTTMNGGTYGAGTIFSITPSGIETVLWSFGNGSDGQNPFAGLIQGTDGNLYGTTLYDGANGDGTVFKF